MTDSTRARAERIAKKRNLTFDDYGISVLMGGAIMNALMEMSEEVQRETIEQCANLLNDEVKHSAYAAQLRSAIRALLPAEKEHTDGA